MIFGVGVHLRFKAAETESSPQPDATFPAGDSQADLVRLLADQIASLTATMNRNNRGRVNRNDNDRRECNDNDRVNRNDNDRRNRNDNARRNRNSYNDRDTRVCDGCSKTGHILKTCPTFTGSPTHLTVPFHFFLCCTTSFGQQPLSIVGCRRWSHSSLLFCRL
jgi:hypothetical protein